LAETADMSTEQIIGEGLDLHVSNIGGIDDTEVSFAPGVTLLVGENATNRTSLLQAVMAGLGSDRASIRADAEEGHVSMTVGDQTYERTLRSRNGTVVGDGKEFLQDPTEAELFAFLLGSNEARRAVALDGDLRELIMQPIDTDAIQSEISRLEDEKREVETRLEKLEQLKEQLPQLETERQGLEREIDEHRAALRRKEEEIEAVDADFEESRAEQADLEETLEDLRRTRSELESVRYKLDTRRESLKELNQERASLVTERADLPEVSKDRLDSIETELKGLRDRRSAIERELSRLQSLVQFNEEMLEGNSDDILVEFDEIEESVTDQLLGDERVCWTCGTKVNAAQIESTVDRLRDLRQERIQESNEVNEQLERLESERDELHEQQRRRELLEQRLNDIDNRIQNNETRIADLETRRDELSEEVTALEKEAERTEQDDYSEIIELHKEANELEFELKRRKEELNEVNERIADIETELKREGDLERELASIDAELDERRTRIERIEQNAIEAFNEHMETVLELLGYANLERIWLERTEREVREGRRVVIRSSFDLHVIRSTASGTVYEDTIDHLSESEREVTGLVFALAGYLAHEVHRDVPVMLLDSVEAIDSDRIAALVGYLEEYTAYLIIALLPGDAAALDKSYRRVIEI
jgi:DNA repair exonuclease SbcCD ATPase subunit